MFAKMGFVPRSTALILNGLTRRLYLLKPRVLSWCSFSSLLLNALVFTLVCGAQLDSVSEGPIPFYQG